MWKGSIIICWVIVKIVAYWMRWGWLIYVNIEFWGLLDSVTLHMWLTWCLCWWVQGLGFVTLFHTFSFRGKLAWLLTVLTYHLITIIRSHTQATKGRKEVYKTHRLEGSESTWRGARGLCDGSHPRLPSLQAWTASQEQPSGSSSNKNQGETAVQQSLSRLIPADPRTSRWAPPVRGP